MSGARAGIAILARGNGWDPGVHNSKLLISAQQSFQMVLVTMLVGGGLGLLFGITLFATRKGGLFANRAVFTSLNILVNTIRPIPFIIFLMAAKGLTTALMGTFIGVRGAIPPMVIACSMATSRIVEQNLIAADPGVIEAGRAMGASRMRVLLQILIPECLAPLILGYAYLFIGVLDLSVMAGAIGAGGLGNFAIVDGYNRYNDVVMWVAVAIFILVVQVVQLLGNVLARRLLRR